MVLIYQDGTQTQARQQNIPAMSLVAERLLQRLPSEGVGLRN